MKMVTINLPGLLPFLFPSWRLGCSPHETVWLPDMSCKNLLALVKHLKISGTFKSYYQILPSKLSKTFINSGLSGLSSLHEIYFVAAQKPGRCLNEGHTGNLFSKKIFLRNEVNYPRIRF